MPESVSAMSRLAAATRAGRLWALGEPFHALIYFADECRAAGEAAGLTGLLADATSPSGPRRWAPSGPRS